MLKKTIIRWIRKLGMMQAFDNLYFLLNKARFSSKNIRFRKSHPLVKLPPEYMLYEAYRLDYESYYKDGIDTANWIREQLSDYIQPERKFILEWGCGPARIIRHLPEVFPHSSIYGSDYNVHTIAWCSENIPGVHFSVNNINPPLSYSDSYFDIAYALSVFTHLSMQNHYRWMDEIYRVLKPGGIFLLTTQGAAFLPKLNPEEKKEFKNGQLVTREKVPEGHRSFSTFQPENFMLSLLAGRWKVLKFISGTPQHWGPEQDTWIVQKI